MDIHQAFTELGLTLQASPHEARAAYRTLAMRWHPDVNDGHPTDTRMQRINVAYALVCQYQDASAAATARATSHAKPSGFTQFDWKTGFQCAAANRGAPDPEPHAVTDAPAAERRLGVSLFEAAFGCTKRVSGTEPVSCLRCTGSGAYAGSWTLASQRPGCFGRGQAPALQTGAERTPCADCRGSGVQRPTAPSCPACRGTGKIERQAWQVDVAIHCGTLDGTQVQPADIQVRQGAASLPQRPHLCVQIDKHPIFKLVHNRLSVSVPISVWRWALGGEISVPTLEGSVRVALPSTPGAMLVKDQGWPEYQAAERRPLFVLPKLIYPERLRIEERRMLELLHVRSNMPEVRGWSRHMQAWQGPSSEPG